jgi:TolA-binding protein
MLRGILSLVMLAGLTVGVSAQDVPAMPGPRRGMQHEDAARLVDAYLVMQLQDRLELTTEQFAKVLPLVQRLQDDRRQYERRRYESLHKLRQMLNRGGASEADITAILREIKKIEAEAPLAIHKDIEALDAVLGLLQQAKYRVLETEVERRIKTIRDRVRAPMRERRAQEPKATESTPHANP